MVSLSSPVLVVHHETEVGKTLSRLKTMGEVALWLYGSVALWLYGSVGLWLCGSVALWLAPSPTFAKSGR